MKTCKLILITLLVLNINNCLAQKDTAAAKTYDRFYISLTGGIGIPVGEFSEFDVPPPDPSLGPANTIYSLAGEARPGFTGKLNVAYFFSKHFGCAFSFFTGSFKTKNKTFNELMIDPTNTVEYTGYSYEAKPWKATGGMLGPVAGASLGKFAFTIKFLVGIQNSASPETTVSFTENDVDHFIINEIITQRHVSTTNFGWDAGLDIRFRTSKKINILFSADYITAKADFSDYTLIEAEINQYTNYGTFSTDYSMSFPFEQTKQISFFSLTAGIAYVFK